MVFAFKVCMPNTIYVLVCNITNFCIIDINVSTGNAFFNTLIKLPHFGQIFLFVIFITVFFSFITEEIN